MVINFNGQNMIDPNDLLMKEATEICRNSKCEGCPLVEGIIRDYGSIICETGNEKMRG